MSECKTKQEFEAKFTANTKYSGFGVHTSMTLPCFACAEPDFMTYQIIDINNLDSNPVQEAMMKGAVCKHCGRRRQRHIHGRQLKTRTQEDSVSNLRTGCP